MQKKANTEFMPLFSKVPKWYGILTVKLLWLKEEKKTLEFNAFYFKLSFARWIQETATIN